MREWKILAAPEKLSRGDLRVSRRSRVRRRTSSLLAAHRVCLHSFRQLLHIRRFREALRFGIPVGLESETVADSLQNRERLRALPLRQQVDLEVEDALCGPASCVIRFCAIRTRSARKIASSDTTSVEKRERKRVERRRCTANETRGSRSTQASEPENV